MDAATLYMVLTLPNGEQSTSTQKFPTLEACEAQVELLRTVEPSIANRQSRPITARDTIRLPSSLTTDVADHGLL